MGQRSWVRIQPEAKKIFFFIFQTKLTETRNSLSELEVKSSETKFELEALQKDLDQTRSENEKLSCQLADMSGHSLKTEKSLQSRNESLQKMVHLLGNRTIHP